MQKIHQQAMQSAQAIANQVASSTNAAQQGVIILVAPRGADSDLFYHITTTRNRALEGTTLLCSATSMERLLAHAVGFIQNLGA